MIGGSSLLARIASIGIGFVAVALSACTQVLETQTFIPAPDGPVSVCQSTLGAYYLPRGLLRLNVIASAADKATTITSGGLDATINMVADRAQAFCLDYLSLPTAQDIITVQRGSNGLLQSITSDVTDETPAIVQTLAATSENLAIAAARSGELTAASAGESIDVEFDPFVWAELIEVKRALRRFGFCIYVEGYSFPTRGLGPAEALKAGREWCSRARVPEPVDPSMFFSTLPVPPEAMGHGVLYRPNAVHKVVILRKPDPFGPGPWTLYQVKRVELPNVSPILSIGVERALFARRKTAINFQNGILTDVSIDKGSELVGFVSIPLSVAKAIVDVPGQILTIRYNDTNNQIALLNAQSQLLQTIQTSPNAPAASDLEFKSGAISDATRSGALRDGQFIGACTNAGGTLADCRDAASGAHR
ncbi:MAG TPA: hypothetical protein VGG01_18130 [Xanthobacteraceae bacterium]|jgi:hypothetical protein